MNFTRMALQQHLGDACGTAEVAVDLEGGMGAEQIRVHPAAAVSGTLVPAQTEGLLDQAVGTVAVVQPGPEVDLPVERPAGAAVAAVAEGHAAGIGELCGGQRGDLVAGVQGPQM